MKLDTECAVLEAVLFSAGEPVEMTRLAEALETETVAVSALADALARHYDETGSALQLLRLGESLQIATRPEFAGPVKALLELRRNTPLSNAAMEALTIIAYNQPVTKGFVERVRGVDSSSVINTLAERGLLEEAGRIEVPGRPVTYRTTPLFLRAFGLSALSDLPALPAGTEQEQYDDIPAPGEEPGEQDADGIPDDGEDYGPDYGDEDGTEEIPGSVTDSLTEESDNGVDA